MNFDDVLMKYKYEAAKPYIKFSDLLDVGCGTGHFLYLVKQDYSFYKPTGIDIDARKIRIAKKYVEGVDFICMRFEDIVYERHWRTITAFNILEHVDDSEWFLMDCKRSLVEGGRLIVTVPNAKALHKRLGDKMGISKPFKLTDTDREKGHRRTYCTEHLKRTMEFCGFEIVAIQGIFLKPFPSDVMMQHYDPKLFDAFYELGKELPEYCSSIMIVGEKR